MFLIFSDPKRACLDLASATSNISPYALQMKAPARSTRYYSRVLLYPFPTYFRQDHRATGIKFGARNCAEFKRKQGGGTDAAAIVWPPVYLLTQQLKDIRSALR
ncbi:hypothetical protein C1J03_10805 [Sulfitobacter sp. SK012]|nr:hypothetical protein C1J03_10805 [Sulfitobacter sp. SK012]